MDNVNWTHVLDHPIVHALMTGNKQFAHGNDSVKFFPAEVAPFAGMLSYTPASFDQLYQMAVDKEAFFIVFTPEEIEIPAPWQLITTMSLYQMVYTGPALIEKETDAIVPLSEKDVPAMLALTRLTNPGPFRERTIELGNYTGIFADGQLVAMAGQRLQPLPYIEISAVCTHPDYTGRGYAGQLIREQIRRIQVQGGIPFLHSKQDNEGAIRLYEKLGFTVCRVNYAYVFAMNT